MVYLLKQNKKLYSILTTERYDKSNRIFSYPVETILTVNEGTFEIECVSGGGQGYHTDGGYDQYSNTDWSWHYYWSGASGAYFKGIIELSQGEHVISVGNNVSSTGGTGGSIKIDEDFIMTGGMNANIAGSDWTGTRQGGQLTVDTIVTETIIYEQGNNGGNRGYGHDAAWSTVAGTPAPVPESLSNYGYGGGTSGGSNLSGGTGYFKITAVTGSFDKTLFQLHGVKKKGEVYGN